MTWKSQNRVKSLSSISLIIVSLRQNDQGTSVPLPDFTLELDPQTQHDRKQHKQHREKDWRQYAFDDTQGGSARDQYVLARLETETDEGNLQIHASQVAFVQSASTLLTRPTKATGMAQMMMRNMVSAQEMIVRILR